MSVPDLFWPEFGNILWKASRRHGRMSLPSAETAIVEMGKLTIPTFSSMPLLSDAFAIAAAFDRTVYDAVYVGPRGFGRRSAPHGGRTIGQCPCRSFPSPVDRILRRLAVIALSMRQRGDYLNFLASSTNLATRRACASGVR